MMRLALLALFLLNASPLLAADWVIASKDARAEAGARFEIVVLAPPQQSLPQELTVRMGVDVAEIALTMTATGPAQDSRRTYAATMPIS
ncbi:MAG: hypothetical protein ACT4P3_16480, partial [Betaproteobacteria bacterium]